MRQTVSIGKKNGDGRGKPAFLVVGHGSRDPRGAREFHELVGLVRERNPGLPVEGGFIELSRPPISECVNRLAEVGARDVAAVPLMLLSAGHAKDDIPATLVREEIEHPEIGFRYGRALGVRPELLGLMEGRISAVVSEGEKPETAVLVVGRGSSDPDANSDIAKIARLFYEGRPYPMVESAFVSMTQPGVVEGLDRLRRLGAHASSSSPTSSSRAFSRSASGTRPKGSLRRTRTWRCATPGTSGPTSGWRTSSPSATPRPSRGTSG